MGATYKVFSDKTAAFVENVHQGLAPDVAARMAGYANPKQDAHDLMKHEGVQRMLGTLARVSKNKKAQISRAEVHEMVMEAFEIAKLSTDAGSMVRAAAELNKMNGFYEPERRVLDVSMTLQEKQQTLKELSDEELLRLAHEEAQDADVIEGEVVYAD